MASSSKRGARLGNVTAMPGVDLETLLRHQGIDLAGLEVEQPVARDPWSTPAHTPAVSDRPARFVVRVELGEVEPVVWRRLELDGSLALHRVHEVLMAAMGWSGAHDYDFSSPSILGPVERYERLDEVVGQAGDRLHYDYDVDEVWELTVEVLEVLSHRPGLPAASCTGGARACPPDVVGGVRDYQRVLAWLRDGTSDPSALARIDRLPSDFDPDAFDPASTDARVQTAADAPMGHARPSRSFDLLERLDTDAVRLVQPWVDGVLGRAASVDDDLAAQLVAPWTALLDHVGDRLPLTEAGYLPPASVAHLLAEMRRGGRLGLHADIAFGKGNREDRVRPLRALRTSAAAAGLVRAVKGALRPTDLGTACRSDPHALLDALIDSLPAGDDHRERDAGWLVLFAAAAETTPRQADVAQVLRSARYLVGREPDEHQVDELTEPTRAVLALAGWNPGRAQVLRHDHRASVLALLAVQPLV